MAVLAVSVKPAVAPAAIAAKIAVVTGSIILPSKMGSNPVALWSVPTAEL
jgi:hypothetical protein